MAQRTKNGSIQARVPTRTPRRKRLQSRSQKAKLYMAGLAWSALPGDVGTPHRFASIIELLIREYRAGIIDDKMKNGVVDLLSTLSHLNMKEALARLLPFIAGDIAPDGQIVARRLT